jgi:hypothetical protein
MEKYIFYLEVKPKIKTFSLIIVQAIQKKTKELHFNNQGYQQIANV